MSEISKRIASRRAEKQKESENTKKQEKSELEKQKKHLTSFMKERQTEIEKNILSKERNKTRLRIFVCSAFLILGMILGSQATMFLQGKALVNRHPENPKYIICKQTGTLKEKPVCLPKL